MRNSVKLLGLGAAIAAVSMLSACHDEQTLLNGEGTVKINASINTDLRINSRATIDELSDSCLIHIYNSKGLVRRYKGISSVPADGIKIKADNYVAEAWAGDSVPASFDKRWFKGREEFTVTNRATTTVNLVCKIANVACAVKYDDKVDETLSEYKMTIGHKGGTLDYVGKETRNGYFMLTPSITDLTWTLTATKADGDSYTRTGTIANAKPTTLYTLHVKQGDVEDPEIGGGYITIVVDETTLDMEETIPIAVSPIFTGVNFDLTQAMICEYGKVGRQEITVAATSALTSFVIESDDLAATVGVDDANNFDIMTASDEIVNSLHTAGINWIYKYDDSTDMSTLNLIFAADLLNSLTEGTHTFDLTATDANNKTSRRTLTIIVTNADVMANAAVDADIWATKATVSARILKTGVTNPGIMYRKKGTQSWTTVAATSVTDNAYTTLLSDLEPGTTYEYAASATDYQSTDIFTFTTEAAKQLPNSGFESWDESNKAHLLYASGEDMFWDSGNHGSATMSVNVTTRSTDKVHGGSSSACLKSQFVGIGSIGKFAAGNVFVGEYLGTSGTNGILGWGRQWTTRPTSLSGWIHYTPKTVDYSETSSIAKGDMDRGIVYIALLDNSIDKEYDSKHYPVIVKTKEKEFFSKDDTNVIAYGEMIFTEATSGDDMQSFTINLTYNRTNVKPSYIVVVASASQYGDYFSGGSSVMYLDDLQLNY